jgi:hypothetical protein
LLLLAGCSPAEQPATLHFEVAGRLENPKIIEASGLARSQREPGVLWTINDSGKPYLYAIDHEGQHLGRVDLNKSDHRDWEDLASFQLDGKPFLLIADIGDNDARYKKRTIYVAKEPRTDENKTKVDWEIDFEYPRMTTRKSRPHGWGRSTVCRGLAGRMSNLRISPRTGTGNPLAWTFRPTIGLL